MANKKKNIKSEIVYFELNNWSAGEDYPNEEPFLTWIGKDTNIYFNDDNWVEENQLCVVVSIIDQSVNFCITSTKDWVEDHCPNLLDYEKFLRYPEMGEKLPYGIWDNHFLEYSKENVGIHYEVLNEDGSWEFDE